jgi:hypothetical protein
VAPEIRFLVTHAWRFRSRACGLHWLSERGRSHIRRVLRSVVHGRRWSLCWRSCQEDHRPG